MQVLDALLPSDLSVSRFIQVISMSYSWAILSRLGPLSVLELTTWHARPAVRQFEQGFERSQRI
jgi:hypothetical protein